jgi:hypothetical protein
MLSDYEALRAETEERLIEFIFGELQVGQTWAETAKIAKDRGHMHHYTQAKESAEKVSSMVQKFMDLVPRGPTRSKIDKQLGELNRLISTV